MNLSAHKMGDCREHGLFPFGDPFLTELSACGNLHPFEKHLPGLTSPHELLRKGSWVSGDSAAENGLDLRLFYQVSIDVQQWCCLQAFSVFWLLAHNCLVIHGFAGPPVQSAIWHTHWGCKTWRQGFNWQRLLDERPWWSCEMLCPSF